MQKKNRYGLVGKNISYSFSRGYFSQKFSDLGLDDHSYENFDLQHRDEFKSLIAQNRNLKGLNVTIPYKEAVIPFLDELDGQAEEIGAVNTIKFSDNKLKGFNTDAFGFMNSIKPYLQDHHTRALILGTGGASKAIAFAFKELGIGFKFVSRTPSVDQLDYEDLDGSHMAVHSIIVNCTPLGTYPDITRKPKIPYTFVSSKHLLFDLIYNPEKSAFLLEGEKQGATTCNGYRMLELQAEKAWEIWNS